MREISSIDIVERCKLRMKRVGGECRLCSRVWQCLHYKSLSVALSVALCRLVDLMSLSVCCPVDLMSLPTCCLCQFDAFVDLLSCRLVSVCPVLSL